LLTVADLLTSDDDLWELLTTPLMLSITALAHGEVARRVPVEGKDAEAQRALLIDAYLVEMLLRRRSRDPVQPVDVLRGMQTLARAAACLGTGAVVPRLGQYEPSGAVPEKAAWFLRAWLAPVSVGVSFMMSGAAMTWRFGLHAGLCS